MKERFRRYWNAHLGYSDSYGSRTDPSEKWLGGMVSTHGRPCSCYLCGNRRRFFGPSIAERRAVAGDGDIAALLNEFIDPQM
jgi:hypothetical protein